MGPHPGVVGQPRDRSATQALTDALGPTWAASPFTWGLVAAGVMFWFNGVLMAATLAGAMIGGRATARAFLLFVVLTAVLVASAWVVIISRFLNSLTA